MSSSVREKAQGLRELADKVGLTAQMVEFQLYARCPPWGRLLKVSRQWGARCWDAAVWGDVTALKVILEIGGVDGFGPEPGPWRIETWVESIGTRFDADRTVFREALERAHEQHSYHWQRAWLPDEQRLRAPVRVGRRPVGDRLRIGVATGPAVHREAVLVPAYVHADGAPVWAEEVPCEASSE